MTWRSVCLGVVALGAGCGAGPGVAAIPPEAVGSVTVSPGTTPEVASVEAAPTYPVLRSRLEAERQRLAADGAGVDEAREVLLDGITRDLLPAWTDTPWDFWGTTQVPGEGEIACGYFVSTVLQHAGIRVERVRMAQQASEYVVRSLAEPDTIRRYRDDVDLKILEDLRAQPPALYVVGLDNHVGFLWFDGATVWFCDSSYVDDADVGCRDARTSPSFRSRYRVVGPALSDRVVEGWLRGAPVVTVLR